MDAIRKIEELTALAERLKQEAQNHAAEARCANSTIYEIYQLCTGATGEPGNWHGAEPVRHALASKEAEIAAREAEIARLREALAVVDAQIPEDFDAAIDHAVLIALGNGDVKLIRAALTKQPPKD